MKAAFATRLMVLAVVAVAGCTSTPAELPVRIDYDKDTPFQTWKTFRFSSQQHSDSGAQTMKYGPMIQKALIEELSARGFERLEDGTPDFRVGFDISFRGDRSSQMISDGGGADLTPKTRLGSNPTGSLTIRMLDPQSSQPLWTGHVTEFKMNFLDPQKELQKAVWRVLVEFPPITG